MIVRVTEVHSSDELKIHTLFSDYSFRVTDPAQCRGFISGGALGDEQHEAFLAGAISPNDETSECSLLETGSRAIFLFVGDDLNRLTTSMITQISLSKAVAQEC